MKQSELVKIIMVLRVAYPYYFKDMSKEDIYAMTSIYKQQFKEYEPAVLMRAVNVLIKDNKYMPTIAELHSESKKQNISFYTDLLERSDIEKDRKKYLKDMLDWYSIQDEVPNEIKNEILGREELTHNEKLKLGGEV